MKENLLTSILVRNYFLLSVVFALVFVVQLFPVKIHNVLFDVLFTIIYFTATLTLDKNRKHFLVVSVVLMILLWVSDPEKLPILSVISKFLAIVFFSLVLFNFIRMIARSKEVNAKVILESINGYLLMGILFSLLVAITIFFNSEAFKFPDHAVEDLETATRFSNYVYYSLVTMSTLGYGDIVPVSSTAKSLATFISISGQLYIAIIIAMLVGKYASMGNKK